MGGICEMDTKKLRAKDIMRTEVKTIGKDMTMLTAVKLMRDFGVSSLIVEPDEDGDAFGIITRKDVVETLVSDMTAGALLLVEDVMTKPAITVSTGLSILNCQQMMRMIGVRRLPVVDGGKLMGVLSNADIFAKLVEGIDR